MRIWVPQYDPQMLHGLNLSPGVKTFHPQLLMELMLIRALFLTLFHLFLSSHHPSNLSLRHPPPQPLPLSPDTPEGFHTTSMPSFSRLSVPSRHPILSTPKIM